MATVLKGLTPKLLSIWTCRSERYQRYLSLFPEHTFMVHDHHSCKLFGKQTTTWKPKFETLKKNIAE